MNPQFDFDQDTQVGRIDEHNFQAMLSARWNVRPGCSNGGYTLAVCLQALKQAINPVDFPDPLVVSASYLRPATNAAAHLKTMVSRIGRRVATGEVSLFQRERQIVRVLATFTNHVIDGFHEEDFEIWDRDGRLVAQSRQLAVLPEVGEGD